MQLWSQDRIQPFQPPRLWSLVQSSQSQYQRHMRQAVHMHARKPDHVAAATHQSHDVYYIGKCTWLPFLPVILGGRNGGARSAFKITYLPFIEEGYSQKRRQRSSLLFGG